MFAMLAQFFAMFRSLFSAGQRSASALDILAGALESTATVYADEIRINNRMQIIELERKLAALENQAPVTKAITAE